MQISNATNRLKNFSDYKKSKTFTSHENPGPGPRNFLANSNLFSSLGDDNLTLDSTIINNANALRRGEKNINELFNSPTPTNHKNFFGNIVSDTDTETVSQRGKSKKKNLFLKSKQQTREKEFEVQEENSISQSAETETNEKTSNSEDSQPINFPQPRSLQPNHGAVRPKTAHPPANSRPRTARNGAKIVIDELRSSYDVPSIMTSRSQTSDQEVSEMREVDAGPMDGDEPSVNILRLGEDSEENDQEKSIQNQDHDSKSLNSGSNTYELDFDDKTA